MHLTLVAELKLLKVDQIYLLQIASFMFRFENNLLAPSFDFPVVRQTHQYNTRSSNSYYIPI